MENTPENINDKPKGRADFTPMTPEQREQMALDRAKEQEWAREHLKLEWLDESYMRNLIAERNLKVAFWWKPASETKHLRRALKVVGKDSLWFKDVFCYNIAEYSKYNPRHPAWVAQAMILEAANMEIEK